ncbi:MAG: DegT/DnrJ/EryC1/StrS aminotransferase family protein [Oscillospiraceae bacterium]
MEFINLKAHYKALQEEIDSSIAETLSDGRYIMGEQVSELEQDLAKFIGVKHAVTCGNGTDALQLIFMAYGIGKGDAVFCPAVTFIASVEPACMLGAEAVFCDIDRYSYNISPPSLVKAIENIVKDGRLKPKAIVAVDFLGNPANYNQLEVIAQKYNLILIEDAAQSMGAIQNTQKCGSFGLAAATSFFPSKPLGCYGDGGAVFTDDDALAEMIQSLRLHGKGKDKYNNLRIGINSRLDTLQAAILLCKLKALPTEMEKKQQVAQYYNKAFKDYFALQQVSQNNVSAFSQYTLLAESTEQRSKILKELSLAKIPYMIYYPIPLNKLPVFQNGESDSVSTANSLFYCERTFSIPFSPYITKDEQEQVISAVLSAR